MELIWIWSKGTRNIVIYDWSNVNIRSDSSSIPIPKRKTKLFRTKNHRATKKGRHFFRFRPFVCWSDRYTEDCIWSAFSSTALPSRASIFALQFSLQTDPLKTYRPFAERRRNQISKKWHFVKKTLSFYYPSIPMAATIVTKKWTVSTLLIERWQQLLRRNSTTTSIGNETSAFSFRGAVFFATSSQKKAFLGADQNRPPSID